MRLDTEDTRVSQISMSFLPPHGVEGGGEGGMECEGGPVRS